MSDPLPQTAEEMRRVLRAAAIARRNALNSGIVAAWSAALVERLLSLWPGAPGQAVGFCWPVQNEPDLRPALLHWQTMGIDTLLPVVIAPGQALQFRRWHEGGAMVADRYGIPTPTHGDFLRPDVLLLPLNAFDVRGYRIGYGGGFFDRTLNQLAQTGQRPLAVGVGFDLAEVPDTQPQPHDARLDWIVTETRALKID